MIKSIALENFQSHKETLIELAPGLNVISGVSDHGKSAVLRGLSWLIKNRPSGDDVRNWDVKPNAPVRVEIVLESEDGKEETVTKQRIGSKVAYLSSRSPVPLEAVRRAVPEEISDLLNLSDINLQWQHDGYFLLDTSAGDVARQLNDLVGLSVIDSSYKTLNSSILDLKRNQESLNKSIEATDFEIAGLSYLDGLLEQLDAAGKMKADIDKSDGRITEISSLLSSIAELQAQLKDVKAVLAAEKQVIAVSGAIASIADIDKKSQRIESTVADIKKFKEELESERAWLSIEKPALEIQAIIKNVLETDSRVKRIQAAINSIKAVTAAKIAGKKATDVLEKALKAKLEEVGACPFCHRILDEETIEGIMK